MKKVINCSGNIVCQCDRCEKPMIECDTVKLATALQKQYNFDMTINYQIDMSSDVTKISTRQRLPFLIKQLTECAENCRKTQEKTK